MHVTIGIFSWQLDMMIVAELKRTMTDFLNTRNLYHFELMTHIRESIESLQVWRDCNDALEHLQHHRARIVDELLCCHREMKQFKKVWGRIDCGLIEATT